MDKHEARCIAWRKNYSRHVVWSEWLKSLESRFDDNDYGHDGHPLIAYVRCKACRSGQIDNCRSGDCGDSTLYVLLSQIESKLGERAWYRMRGDAMRAVFARIPKSGRRLASWLDRRAPVDREVPEYLIQTYSAAQWAEKMASEDAVDERWDLAVSDAITLEQIRLAKKALRDLKTVGEVMES